MFFHFVHKSGLERLAKKGIVEMLNDTPKTIVREPSFRNKAMNVRIPFKRTAKGVENTDKAWDKIFRFVQLVKHTKYNTADSVKQTIQKRTVLKKKETELFVNGKNTVAVSTLNQLKGHGIGSVLAVFYTTGWTKSAFTAERHKFEVSTFGTGIHCPTK
jgi:hypothetical protein